VAANTPSVIQQACGHEFVSFLKIGNSRGDGHVHFFSSTTYAKAGRTFFRSNCRDSYSPWYRVGHCMPRLFVPTCASIGNNGARQEQTGNEKLLIH
ncbi:MAG TPA: hypothetical protein VFC78_03640, partial [Tepidisphaeraceae bacterium]|nr:hypothetical protein [Tepidisphaeraceae bacterium]